MASAASVAVGSSLTVRESLARVRSPRASARLPATPTVSWKKMVSNLAASATWVMWAYCWKSMSDVGIASGWRQPARWLPGTLKKPPSRSCLVIGRRRVDLHLATWTLVRFLVWMFGGIGTPRFSRKVLPSYWVRKMPRRCSSGMTIVTHSSSGLG